MVLDVEQRSSKVWVLALKSQLVSVKFIAKVPESEHLGAGNLSEGSGCEQLGAGGISEVSAKPQSVGTWAREVPECEHLGAGSLLGV